MNAAYTGEQIAQRRKALGLTQKQLADQLYVTDKAVSKWERGINYPDLGILEPLARALETTPAVLLGLEDAQQDEMLRSAMELSRQETEDAWRCCRWAGWMSAVAAVVMLLAYNLFGRNHQHNVWAYYLLTGGTVLCAIWGIYLLVHSGEIRHWEVPDVFLFWGTVFPVMGILLCQLFNADNPPDFIMSILIGWIAVCLQLLVCRMIRPLPVRLLPLLAALLFALRRWSWYALRPWNWYVPYLMPAIGCGAGWALWIWWKNRKRPDAA